MLGGRGIKLRLEEPLGNVYDDVAIQNGGGVQGTHQAEAGPDGVIKTNGHLGLHSHGNSALNESGQNIKKVYT